MKIIHEPDIDYVSIDFKEGIEDRSYFENGIKEGKVKYRKPNNKDYRFKKKDILKLAS